MRTLALLLFLLSLAFAGPSLAQQTGDTIRVRTREVNLDVLVKDKRTGLSIDNLTSENFEVLDNGKPRKISHFSRAGEARARPSALVLVLDLWPSGAGRFYASRALRTH